MTIDNPDAVVYSKENCPWCEKAISLLTENGFTVKELKLGIDYTKESLLEKVKPAKTVPQIFVDEQLVGGYDHINSYFSMQKGVLNGTSSKEPSS